MAVFSGAGATAAVKTKSPNALGLYDMTGNVVEWTFDLSGSDRVRRGAHWHSETSDLQLGHVFSLSPYTEDNSGGGGFRFARTP